MTTTVETKTCWRCKRSLPVSEFWRDKSRYDGLQSACRECLRGHSKRWREANPERVRQHRIQRAFPDNYADRQRKWGLDYYHRKASSDPHYVLAQAERRARSRAVELGAPIDIDLDYSRIVERDGTECYLCGEAVDHDTRGFDHVLPLSAGGGHTWDNVRVCHRRCNERKGRKRLADLDWAIASTPNA